MPGYIAQAASARAVPPGGATPLPGYVAQTASARCAPAYSTPVKWYGERGLDISKSAAGRLSGHVYDGGVVVPYALVRAYYRPTGVLLGALRADAAGYFSFAGLDPSDAEKFYVVAFDPEGGTQYNALVLDRLTPVT